MANSGLASTDLQILAAEVGTTMTGLRALPSFGQRQGESTTVCAKMRGAIDIRFEMSKRNPGKSSLVNLSTDRRARPLAGVNQRNRMSLACERKTTK
jgi:hypothetical protein